MATMNIETLPRNKVARLPTKKVISTLVESTPRKTATPSRKLPVKGPTGAEIRIHKDGMLIAKCQATGTAPSRLYVAIDPLHYPVNSRLEIEFVNHTDQTSKPGRLPATVTSRSIKGIELKLDTALA